MTYEEARRFTSDCMGFTCEHCGWQNDCKDKDKAAEYEYTVRQALEKQIPKKPIKMDTQEIRYTDSYRCPSCNGSFTGTGIADYCYHCGQKLEWGDED